MGAIFKKLSQQKFEKHKPNYSGQFPIQTDKLDADYVKHVQQEHKNQSILFETPDDYTEDTDGYFGGGSGHYIVHGDGGLSKLYLGHRTHLASITDAATLPNPTANPDKLTGHEDERRRRYWDNHYSEGDVYKLIHHLFDGGIRLFYLGKRVVITAYQIPSDEQLNMIQKFCEIQGITSIDMDLYLQKSEKNRDITHYDYRFDSFESFKSKMLKLRYSPRNLDQDAIRRIQLLQSFRNDSDFENPKPADFATKPKPASELGRKLTREEIKDILSKYPPLRNMEKSARNRAIIRIAERLDENNCYQQSDWVMEMVNEV